uniref:Uncharacterized protein n=1 Tax=Sphaerodactylus townsendi TaxID=933632 RepID=A0ACB8FV87_9SAUR
MTFDQAASRLSSEISLSRTLELQESQSARENFAFLTSPKQRVINHSRRQSNFHEVARTAQPEGRGHMSVTRDQSFEVRMRTNGQSGSSTRGHHKANRPKCYRCHQEGHLVDECPNNTQRKYSPPNEMKFKDRTGRNYFLKPPKEGIREIILDSGATQRVYAVQHCTGNNDCFDESENNDVYYDSDFKVHEVNFAKSCKPDNRERQFIQQSHAAEKVFWNKDFKKQCFDNKYDGLCLKDYNTRELCDMNEQNGFCNVYEFSDCDNDDFESREMNDDDEWDFENEDCNFENCEDDLESETEFDYASDYQFMPSGGGTP